MTALNLNDTMGCTLIGVLFATLFYGFSCAQTMFYFYTYRKDKLRLKILVAFLWLLGTARAIVDAAYIWYFLVLNHATLEGLEKNPTQYGITEYLFAALMIVIVQLFYVHSIWIFLEGKWFRMPVTLTIVFLSLFSFGNGLAMLIELARHPAVKSALTFTILPGTMQPASAFLTDLYIATSLSVILKQQKTGLKGTDYLLSKLALYAIHRGIFTAVFELLELLTFASTLHQTKLLWALFHFPGSQVYVNCLLAWLEAVCLSTPQYHLTVVYIGSTYADTSKGPNFKAAPFSSREMRLKANHGESYRMDAFVYDFELKITIHGYHSWEFARWAHGTALYRTCTTVSELHVRCSHCGLEKLNNSDN